jgi:hypothetical protein
MKMASFLAGFGGGYLKAKDKALEDERRAKQDAWQEEVQGRQRKEWESKDRLDADLKDAVTPVAVEQPDDVLKDDDGNDMPAVPAFRAGTKRFATMEDATKAANELNTPEAQNTRVLDAYKRSGQFDKALTMQTAMRQGELGEIQLANAKFQQRIGDWMGSGFDGFRDGLNSYEGGPFKGKKVDFVLSEDGKTRSVVSIGPDGQPQPTGLVVPNSNEGIYQLGYILDKAVTPAERLKMHRDEVKLDLEGRKVDALEKRTEATMQSLLARAGGGSGGGRAASSQAAAGGLPSPMEGFDSKKAYAIATEQAAAELSQQGDKPPSGQAIAKRATEIYRALEGEFQRTGAAQMVTQAFANDASKVKTPAEMQILLQQGQAAGMTPAQMAAIAPRFAQLAQPTQQPGQTAKNPMASNAPAEPAPKPKPEKPQPNFMTRMLPQARIQNLETMAARGVASKAELQELQDLKALQGKEWWRGRASDASY